MQGDQHNEDFLYTTMNSYENAIDPFTTTHKIGVA